MGQTKEVSSLEFCILVIGSEESFRKVEGIVRLFDPDQSTLLVHVVGSVTRLQGEVAGLVQITYKPLVGSEAHKLGEALVREGFATELIPGERFVGEDYTTGVSTLRVLARQKETQVSVIPSRISTQL